ncbi:MAG: alpha/beta hydrolase [Kofleriaceae bacterium]|nr:alpha/beta hydrolase [Kofleriaceae bacterium]
MILFSPKTSLLSTYRLTPLALLVLSMFAFGCHHFHAGPMPGAPPDAKFFTVDGVRLHYTDVGEGPAIVLIHGFGSSLEIWHKVVPELSSNHRVVAIDLKGFGWSSRPEGNYSPTEQGRLVLALMSQLGIEKADVVGHSWGASVALALALQAPKRVHRIALYGAWIYEEQLPPFFLWARAWGVGEFLFSAFYGERMEDQVAHAYYDPSSIPQERIEAIKELFSRPGTKAAALTAVRDQRYDKIQKRYKTLSHPTLLLWGREDQVARLHFGERLRSDIPNARLKVYPRCGHLPMIEAAASSTRDLVEFLQPQNLTMLDQSPVVPVREL